METRLGIIGLKALATLSLFLLPTPTALARQGETKFDCYSSVIQGCQKHRTCTGASSETDINCSVFCYSGVYDKGCQCYPQVGEENCKGSEEF